MLVEDPTSAVSGCLVANAGCSPSACCHGPAGLTDPDPGQLLISDASLMAGRLTEGSEPFGSSPLLPPQCAGTSRIAVGSPGQAGGHRIRHKVPK